MLNLARRPFVNRRPLRRLTVLLWSGVVVLGTINLFLFWGYQSGSTDARDSLAEIRENREAAISELQDARQEFAGFDLETQNLQVDFLNERLAERAFPWSRLFEDLEEVLPISVRVESLAPRDTRTTRRRTGQRTDDSDSGSRWIQLAVSGKARTPDDLLTFVDSLFSHPSFGAPNLTNESQATGGETQFRLEVNYLVRMSESSLSTQRDVEPSTTEQSDPPAEPIDPTLLTNAEPSTANPTESGVAAPSTPTESSQAQTPVARTAAPAQSVPATTTSAEVDSRIAGEGPESNRDRTGEGREEYEPRSVEPAQRVTLRETQNDANAGTRVGVPVQTPTRPGPSQPGGTRASGSDAPSPGDDRTLDARDLRPAPRRTPVPDDPGTQPVRDGRGGDGRGRDRRDLFPVRDASGSGGGS